MGKIFFELEPVQNGGQNHFRARLQISDALKATPVGLSEKAAEIEHAYKNTIIECRELYRKVRASKRGERLYLYWDLADKIYHFLRHTDQVGFFLNYPDRHLARDLEVTSRTISYLLTFRKQIADKKQLDPAKPWSYYIQRSYRMRKRAKDYFT